MMIIYYNIRFFSYTWLIEVTKTQPIQSILLIEGLKPKTNGLGSGFYVLNRPQLRPCGGSRVQRQKVNGGPLR